MHLSPLVEPDQKRISTPHAVEVDLKGAVAD